MSDLTDLPDLASRTLGATVVWTNDEFYAGADNLLTPEPAIHDRDAYALRGKVYDGWETRRRRAPGDDSVIIRLGAAGIVRGVVIDTAFFAGNYPPFATVETTALLGYPSAGELHGAQWRTIAHRVPLKGDTVNLLDVRDATTRERLATHVRLTIHPDGGVARLRVHGDVVPDPRWLGGRPDLAATTAGGRIADCSNRFYSSPANVLAPGRAGVMSDGWETARRRDDGNEWVLVTLAAPGELTEAVVDTWKFVGNAPGWAKLTGLDAAGAAHELLPRTALVPDTEHRFRLRRAPAVTQVRLDIYPDGGISRLHLLGSVAEDARGAIADRWLSLLPGEQAARVQRSELFI